MGQFTKPLITNKIPRLSTQYFKYKQQYRHAHAIARLFYYPSNVLLTNTKTMHDESEKPEYIDIDQSEPLFLQNSQHEDA
jgi:hypothetical protein